MLTSKVSYVTVVYSTNFLSLTYNKNRLCKLLPLIFDIVFVTVTRQNE